MLASQGSRRPAAGLVGGLLLLLTGCGGGSSGSSGPSEAPTISNLRVQHTSQVVSLIVDVVDAQGDVFGGECRLRDQSGEQITGPINTLAPGTNPNITTGVVTCNVQVLRSGVPINATLFVADRARHESNGLAVTFVTESRHGERTAARGPALGPTDSQLGR